MKVYFKNKFLMINNIFLLEVVESNLQSVPLSMKQAFKRDWQMARLTGASNKPLSFWF